MALDNKDVAVQVETPVVRWFGKVETCDYSKDLCRPFVESVEKEPCYYFQLEDGRYFCSRSHCLMEMDAKRFLTTLLGSGDVRCKDAEGARTEPKLHVEDDKMQFIVEIGPKLRHRTPWCAHVISACQSVHLALKRIEKTYRYKVTIGKGHGDKTTLWHEIVNKLHDSILEQVYETPITTFFDEVLPPVKTWEEIPVKVLGKHGLEEANKKHSLGFDAQDIDQYFKLFAKLGRNPTLVELYDLAQSNSEHSRHWFFNGKYNLNGEPLPQSLMEMVKATNKEGCFTNLNNVIKFKDNSSAIQGFPVYIIESSNVVKSSWLWLKERYVHLLLTAETHNFPTGVAPFSGAATGTGGRIRDVMATGRGANVLAATAGYCVGQLHIDGYKLPWEQDNIYEGHFEQPLKIIIEASNGASDYGNKFGEPVLGGFFRAFGCNLGKERREWIKPIMFSAGVGTLYDKHVNKVSVDPREYLRIGKIGGPAYRIGIGGGSASSVEVQGANDERTANAVQRGDPEMGNKLNRFVRACIETKDNPILSIHDQGAGGNANVLKEIVEGYGADICATKFTLGDNTLTLQELWCAEYQESNAILFKEHKSDLLRQIAKRERCQLDIVGDVRETDRFRFIHCDMYSLKSRARVPVDFPLKELENMPRKTFNWIDERQPSDKLQIADVSVEDAITRVLRLPSVGSKRFLTSKVDRSVTGLVAQQQCVGARQLPLADLAVVACSYFSHEGIATSTGEQPIITMLNPAAGARMSLMEALASLAMAPITSLQDVKCSVNWMWPAKLPGEGYQLYVACEALCNLMRTVGVAVDGGKDSLGMAAMTRSHEGREGEVVKAPGTVVVTAYAPCTDITKVVTPDIKGPRTRKTTDLLLVRPVVDCRARLGGSALAQVYGDGALGEETPDFRFKDAGVFVKAFEAMQQVVKEGMILACHDISEGGLLTCIVEMAMAGCCGVDVTVPYILEQDAAFAKGADCAPITLATLFAEEIGWVLEVEKDNVPEVQRIMGSVPCFTLGETTYLEGLTDDPQTVRVRGGPDKMIWFDRSVKDLRSHWEETSFRLELYQTARACAKEEYDNFKEEKEPKPYTVPFAYKERWPAQMIARNPFKVPRVAILREEGTNGDREMAAALMMAGFYVVDMTMSDLFHNKCDLREYRGLIFPGGFSYADSLGAAVGWAASIKGDTYARNALQEWRQDEKNFSLAVCNGCQLTALLGWQNLDGGFNYDYEDLPDHRYTTNLSGRFESRWCRVKMEHSNSILLADMEGAVLGIWAAHKEGRFTPSGHSIAEYRKQNMIALKYVDDQNLPTEQYPHNPNGSIEGIAGIVSSCGRHLSMMPHPERCVLKWQWPDLGRFPDSITRGGENVHVKAFLDSQGHKLDVKDRRDIEYGLHDTTPWAKMFQNAFDWCLGEGGLEMNIGLAT